jgi:hypothetical protein
VVLPARMRIGARWSDACILNISSHGLMIRTANRITDDSVVELRRGEHVIFARVVWRDGPKAGLQTDERVPVEEIITLDPSTSLQVTAADALLIERRNQPRRICQDSRLRARAIESIGVVAIAAMVGAGAFGMVELAFARPLAMVRMALGG